MRKTLECRFMAQSRSSGVQHSRSGHRRITDVPARMSVHRRIADAAQRGREGRHMTQNGHSASSRFLPLTKARGGVRNVSNTPEAQHGVDLIAMSTTDPIIVISHGSLVHGSPTPTPHQPGQFREAGQRSCLKPQPRPDFRVQAPSP